VRGCWSRAPSGGASIANSSACHAGSTFTSEAVRSWTGTGCADPRRRPRITSRASGTQAIAAASETAPTRSVTTPDISKYA
jgi:hypothetical protein